MVCTERAAEGLADVGGAEGWGEVEDGAQDEGRWVRGGNGKRSITGAGAVNTAVSAVG